MRRRWSILSRSLDYADVMTIVANGKKDVSESSQLVMPTFGENKNIMCYIDAIYIYLRARSDRCHSARPSAGSRAETKRLLRD